MMETIKAELQILENGKWGCFLWLKDSRGDSTRTILAIGDTPDQARESALLFSRAQHEGAQRRLIDAQSSSIACREMVEAVERVRTPAVDEEVERIQKLVAAFSPGRKA